MDSLSVESHSVIYKLIARWDYAQSERPWAEGTEMVGQPGACPSVAYRERDLEVRPEWKSWVEAASARQG